MDKDKILDLLGYITTSAKELLIDPPKYGPYRLINVASRLITVYEEEGLADNFMLELRDYIDENKFCAENDEEKLKIFLNNLVKKITLRSIELNTQK